jgi:hypothetical protein
MASIFAPSFGGRNRLLTNEWAYRHPGRRQAVVSADWVATSGSLFAHDGAGWSGLPDDNSPDPTSQSGTGSAVLRVVSQRPDFGDVEVDVRFRIEQLVSSQRTPAQSYDGMHLFLRYQSEYQLYAVTLARRDGLVAVKKKVPGGPSNDGTYTTLASAPRPLQLGVWQALRTTVTNEPGRVVIRLFDDDRMVLQAIDDGADAPPLFDPGRVGIRGDNAELSVQAFAVRPL